MISDMDVRERVPISQRAIRTRSYRTRNRHFWAILTNIQGILAVRPAVFEIWRLQFVCHKHQYGRYICLLVQDPNGIGRDTSSSSNVLVAVFSSSIRLSGDCGWSLRGFLSLGSAIPSTLGMNLQKASQSLRKNRSDITLLCSSKSPIASE